MVFIQIRPRARKGILIIPQVPTIGDGLEKKPFGVALVVIACLECGQTMELGNPLFEGLTITCPDCRTKMEVICVDPLELDWVYEGPVCLWDEWPESESTPS